MGGEIRRTSLVPQTKVGFDFDFDKFIAAVHYMAVRSVPEFDKYKICKMLFLADKYHLVRYGRPIIGDRYCPLPHGPVPSHSLDLLNQLIRTEDPSKADIEIQKMGEVLGLDRKFQYPRFVSKAKLTPKETNVLSKSDIEALDHIIRNFGNKSFIELKSLTHSVYAYRKAVEELSDLRYEDFFEEDADAIEGAFEEMLENDEISKAFPPK